MANYLFSLTSYKLVIAFFATAILFPFVSYSQQTPVKRVEIVVTAKEKPEISIIQLPANNLPASAKTKGKTKVYTKRKSISSIFSSPKKNRPSLSKRKTEKSAKISKIEKPFKPKQNTADIKQELIKPKQEIPPNQTSLSKLKPTAKPERLKTDTPKSIQKEEKPIVKSNKSKVDIITSGDVEHSNAQISETDKQNTVTYVWIGVILIVAGIVLGMLFGRTAFLVSFIGLIFILLGVFVF